MQKNLEQYNAEKIIEIMKCLEHHKHCCRCSSPLYNFKLKDEIIANCEDINFKVELCDECAERSK